MYPINEYRFSPLVMSLVLLSNIHFGYSVGNILIQLLLQSVFYFRLREQRVVVMAVNHDISTFSELGINERECLVRITEIDTFTTSDEH